MPQAKDSVNEAIGISISDESNGFYYVLYQAV